MKSQSALEFMTIVATGLILLIIATYFGYNFIDSYFSDVDSLDARQMSNNIASSVNLVYSQGVGAKTKVSFTVPSNVVLNRTYASDREINIRYGDPPSDGVAIPAVDVYGTLPTRAGSNALFVEMKADGAELRIEDEISLLKVVTYNDSGHSNIDTNFSGGDTVYYSVQIEDFGGNLVNTNLVISVYMPSMTGSGYGSSGSSTNGYYNSSFSLVGGEETGYWLLSALHEEERIVGTQLFYVN